MSLRLAPMALREGDQVTLAGRPETVYSAPEEADGWVEVSVVGDYGDPYLVRPHDTVPVHNR